MTSLAMILNDCDVILENGQAVNPLTLNEWLINNNGYSSSGNVVWGAVN
jgi:hypothetical protein